MSVKIRLKRMGRKKRPFYRLVAIDSKKRRDGLEIERLGWYDPQHDQLKCNIHEDRVLFWLDQGALPSDTVKGLFRREGLSYKWYLMQQGIKGLELDKLLDEWDKREKYRLEKAKSKKVKKKELSKVEEVPAEAAAEETPAEEAPAEAEPLDLAANNPEKFGSYLELVTLAEFRYEGQRSPSLMGPTLPEIIGTK